MAFIEYVDEEAIPAVDRVPDQDNILSMQGVHSRTMRVGRSSWLLPRAKIRAASVPRLFYSQAAFGGSQQVTMVPPAWRLCRVNLPRWPSIRTRRW